MSIMRFGVSSFISKSSDSNTFIFVLCFDIIGVPTGPRNAIARSNVMFVFSRYLNASHQIVLLFLQKVNLSKHFDINAENKIIAMQILTSDVMQMMIEFREQSKIKYELDTGTIVFDSDKNVILRALAKKDYTTLREASNYSNNYIMATKFDNQLSKLKITNKKDLKIDCKSLITLST